MSVSAATNSTPAADALPLVIPYASLSTPILTQRINDHNDVQAMIALADRYSDEQLVADDAIHEQRYSIMDSPVAAGRLSLLWQYYQRAANAGHRGSAWRWASYCSEHVQTPNFISAPICIQHMFPSFEHLDGLLRHYFGIAFRSTTHAPLLTIGASSLPITTTSSLSSLLSSPWITAATSVMNSSNGALGHQSGSFPNPPPDIDLDEDANQHDDYDHSSDPDDDESIHIEVAFAVREAEQIFEMGLQQRRSLRPPTISTEMITTKDNNDVPITSIRRLHQRISLSHHQLPLVCHSPRLPPHDFRTRFDLWCGWLIYSSQYGVLYSAG
jgi:hypothetical protein